MSQDHNHLNHATWECKYHVVFTTKYRKKALFGQIRRHLGTVFRGKARSGLHRMWTQAAQLFGSQILGEGLLRFDRRAGRGDEPRSCPHKVPSLVPESFITASGGSPPNPQLCWGSLALPLSLRLCRSE